MKWPKLWRRDPDEAQNLIDATEAWERGDLALFAWINQAETPREREFRRRAGLVVLAVEAEEIEQGRSLLGSRS